MITYKAIHIHPEFLDQNAHFTHLASVDAQTDIILDRVAQSALSWDQKQELAALMEMMRTVAEFQKQEITEETYQLAVPA